jgi:hypothetical protein
MVNDGDIFNMQHNLIHHRVQQNMVRVQQDMRRAESLYGLSLQELSVV